MKLLPFLLALTLAAPALAGPPAIPPSAPLAPANLAKINNILSVPLRAPTVNDDWTKGYFAAGQISGATVVTTGVCTVAPSVTVAAPGSGVTATFSVSLNGSTPVLKLTNPGTGYTAASIPSITNSGGTCTTAPVWTSNVNPVPAQWRDTQNNIYQLLQSNAGQAVWQQQNVIGLPGDVQTGAVALYGVLALNQAWLNGNFADVATTPGGATTTIKFINGVVDTASLCKLIGSGSGYVSTLYDQSGNARNATQATGANQPQIRCNQTIGGQPSIIFVGNQYLVLPAGVAVTTQRDFAAFVVQKTLSASQGWISPSFELTNVTYPFNLANGCGTLDKQLSYWLFSTTNITYDGASNTSLLGYSGVAASYVDLFGQNYAQQFSAVGSPFALAGGYIGKATAGCTGGGGLELGAVAFYNAGVTNANLPAVQSSYYRLFNITPQTQDVVFTEGDSLTQGLVSATGRSYARQMEPTLFYPSRLVNHGESGKACSDMVTNYATRGALWYNSAARNNILALWCGTNDLSFSASVATTYASMTSYVALAKATGYKVVCATMLPRNASGNISETTRGQLNTLIKANSAGCDAIADVGGDPTIGAAGANSNGTYYLDGIHPTDLGFSYIAPYFAAAINTLTK